MEELDASATIEDEEAAIAADEDEACQEMFSTPMRKNMTKNIEKYK